MMVTAEPERNSRVRSSFRRAGRLQSEGAAADPPPAGGIYDTSRPLVSESDWPREVRPLIRRWNREDDFAAFMVAGTHRLVRMVEGAPPAPEGHRAGRYLMDLAFVAAGRYSTEARRAAVAAVQAAVLEVAPVEADLMIITLGWVVDAARWGERRRVRELRKVHAMVLPKAAPAFTPDGHSPRSLAWLAVSACSAPWDFGATGQMAVHWAERLIRAHRGIPQDLQPSQDVQESAHPRWAEVVAIDEMLLAAIRGAARWPEGA